MSGAFPVDLILFGLVAAFLVLRLRSVLGRRTGYERPPQIGPQPQGGPPAPPQPVAYDPRQAAPPPGPASAVAARKGRLVPDARTPPGQALSRIAAADQGFDPYRFLDGAEAAFRMIVAAFAAGDRATLRSLLSEETYAGFEQAITAREQAGHTQRTEVRALPELAIEAADLRGRTADITVKFTSDQVNITTATGGEIVAGHDGVTELHDIWTFQRELGATDPSWRLVATRSA